MRYAIGSDLVPTMTAATTDGVTVSDGGSINSDYRGWKAFDDIGTTMWNDGITGSNWVIVDFGSGNTKIVAAYTLKSRHDGYKGDSPKNWTLQASSDGIDWTVLDTQTEAVVWSKGEKRQFNIDERNINSYRFYKYEPTTNNGTGNHAIAEIELLEGISIPSSSSNRRMVQVI